MMKKVVLFICVLGSCVQITYAQSDEVLAKSYFLKAQQAYSEGNSASAMTNLDKTVEYLGGTNAKIESIYVKIYLANNDYINTEKHLDAYFNKASESHSDYMEMLEQAANIKSIAVQIRNINTQNLDFYKFGLEGLAWVWFDGKGGALVDKTTKLVTKFYDSMSHCSEGRCKVERDGLDGFIDSKTGEEVIPVQFKYASPFKEDGTTNVRQPNGEIAVINKSGEIIYGWTQDGEYIPPKF